MREQITARLHESCRFFCSNTRACTHTSHSVPRISPCTCVCASPESGGTDSGGNPSPTRVGQSGPFWFSVLERPTSPGPETRRARVRSATKIFDFSASAIDRPRIGTATTKLLPELGRSHEIWWGHELPWNLGRHDLPSAIRPGHNQNQSRMSSAYVLSLVRAQGAVSDLTDPFVLPQSLQICVILFGWLVNQPTSNYFFNIKSSPTTVPFSHGRFKIYLMGALTC